MSLNFKNLSVLLIEDNKGMKDLISSVLDGLGVKNLRMASDGENGFRLFQQENSDIIIADWEMQPVNGIEFTKTARRSSMSPNKMVPIILLTGYAAPQRVKIARDAGVTEYLIKPFTADALIKRITHVINNPRRFVVTETYVGPDRRRRQDPKFKGPFRRADDKQ